MWGGDGFPEYVPVAEKRRKAQKALEKLQKKSPDIQPVVISGNKIAKTWWGVAWNKNLESYADYNYRLDRGRSYVRNGFVLDLRIEPGRIAAIVAGSTSTPYQVQIRIAALAQAKWERITALCGRSIAGIEQLARGEFPKALEALFTQKGEGLFPTPKEIQFSCTCPDGAYLCKHVAAALYGVGARFDEAPPLFFKLRNIEIEALMKKSIEEKMTSMLKNAGKKTRRVIENADIAGLFGV